MESEISCVIDDVVFPNWEPSGLDRWKRALGPIDIDLVAIIPQWSVIRDRNAARDETDRIPQEMLRKIYDDMVGWRDRPDVPVVDNSTLSITETIIEIERSLAKRRP